MTKAAILGVLKQLAEAADVYAADQSRATDPRCGRVQPVTVEQAELLNATLRLAWQTLNESRA